MDWRAITVNLTGDVYADVQALARESDDTIGDWCAEAVRQAVQRDTRGRVGTPLGRSRIGELCRLCGRRRARARTLCQLCYSRVWRLAREMIRERRAG